MQFWIFQLYEEFNETPVEGSMNIPNANKPQNIGEPDFNTLDEPISVTVVIFFIPVENFFIPSYKFMTSFSSSNSLFTVLSIS